MFKDYIPAIIGFSGVILGAIISAFMNYFMKKKETQLRIAEKIFDKRIKAHEDALLICQQLRITQGTGLVDIDGDAITYSVILLSLEDLYKFQEDFMRYSNPNLHWMNIELVREMNYVQDYMHNLYNYLSTLSKEDYFNTAFQLKFDIILIAENLEREIKKFFQQDIFSVSIRTRVGHHKLPKNETRLRLNKTKLGEYLNLKIN